MLVLFIFVITFSLPLVSFAFSDAGAEDEIDKMEPISLDAPYPEYDYSRANKLPMTGYFKKSFSVNGQVRSAGIYISPEAPIRSYFTVIAVPDGVSTEEFLMESGWIDLANEKEEGLFILEPGRGGWGDFYSELDYVKAAMDFYMTNNYFSIFGEHYLVGYGNGAPVLEAWAAANPLKVISQVYIDSKGLEADYFEQFKTMEFGGKNANYVEITFPEDFKKVTYDEVVLPTWYINPDKDSIVHSLNYWKHANDCVAEAVEDETFGEVYKQKKDSMRWMTNYSGPISKVAVLDNQVDYLDRKLTYDIDKFLTYYTRYENAVAYGNQLVERADYDKLGIEVHTMMVNGQIREYMIYVPDSAREIWGDAAPVLWVWAGNTQTDKVFLDATQWWKPAQEKGFILVIPCEQYSASPISVSHKDVDIFYKQLKEVLIRDYGVDPTRFYSTGQSAGSMVTQSFAAAFPEEFAAVASTSAVSVPSAEGTVRIDGLGGKEYPVKNEMIPNYLIYGAGDLMMIEGDLWDDKINDLDKWAEYHLSASGFTLDDVDDVNGVVSGWYDRYRTWTWSRKIGDKEVPLFKVTKNLYRSHNCIYEEMPILLDFLEHYSCEVDENGNVIRWYSQSGFRVEGDRIRIN